VVTVIILLYQWHQYCVQKQTLQLTDADTFCCDFTLCQLSSRLSARPINAFTFITFCSCKGSVDIAMQQINMYTEGNSSMIPYLLWHLMFHSAFTRFCSIPLGAFLTNLTWRIGTCICEVVLCSCMMPVSCLTIPLTPNPSIILWKPVTYGGRCNSDKTQEKSV